MKVKELMTSIDYNLITIGDHPEQAEMLRVIVSLKGFTIPPRLLVDGHQYWLDGRKEWMSLFHDLDVVSWKLEKNDTRVTSLFISVDAFAFKKVSDHIIEVNASYHKKAQIAWLRNAISYDTTLIKEHQAVINDEKEEIEKLKSSRNRYKMELEDLLK